jgi:radical SAM superfamily enzyme YgiQ (UPF0313 family)
MKVLLIRPGATPYAMGVHLQAGQPHVGIGYLASVLLKNGHEVEIVDMRIDRNRKKLYRKISDFNPDYIGITSLSNQFDIAYKLVDGIKGNFDTPIVFGGFHVSVMREKVLHDTKADYGVLGEGEYTLLELVNGVDPAKIKGLIWRKGPEIITNPPREFITDLDSLPFPAFERFPLKKYLDKKIPIATSRGCPYHCTYCGTKLNMGRNFRPRSPENVVEEMEYWYRKGYRYIEFNDDCFNFDMRRAERICDLLIEKHTDLKWDIRNGIRVDRVSKPLLKKMKAAGCFFVGLGIESANPDTLKSIKKGIKLEQAERAVKLCKEVGLDIDAFFIVGLPSDNYESFKRTLSFAQSLDLGRGNEVRFFNLVPFPGSELFEWIQKNGHFIYPVEEYLNSIGNLSEEPIFETPDFTKEERAQAFQEAQEFVMSKFLATHFGPFIGKIAFFFWKNKRLRGATGGLGWRALGIARRIRVRLT